MMGSLSFEGLGKSYGEVEVVRDVSLTIAEGEFVSLLGPSGCGKTTILRMVAGLVEPSRGRILIGRDDVTTLPPNKRGLGLVFQSYALFPHMTVADNVAYGLTVKRMPKAEAYQKAEQGLELVGLKGFGNRLPSELSGGQQQRVAVARAIVLEPEVLLLDEPLSNLDAKLRRHVREEIRQIQQRLGLTAVYVTHDQEEAMAVSDRIIVMKNAEIAQAGTPHDLYERPASAFIADFIGDANLLPAEVVGADEGTRLRLLDQDLTLPMASDLRGAVRIVLRPHQVRLSAEATPGTLPAVVTYAAYLGNQIQYTLASEAGEIFAVAAPVARPFGKGDHVFVGWNPQDLRLVAAPDA